VTKTPTTAIKAAQALATTLAIAGLPLLAAVVRGVLLLLSPTSQAIFEQNQAGSTTGAVYSVVLGYGVPTFVFSVLYAVVALRISRGRRWTFVLGLALSMVGVILCVTTISQLLPYAAIVLGAFQAMLALLLLASFRYFWSSPAAAAAAGPAAAGPADPEPPSGSDDAALESPSAEAEPSA
jgi:hypothetical protein